MSIDILIAEYPGDLAWQRFVDVFPHQPGRPRLGLQDEGIERVLAGDMGENGSRWLEYPVPALEHRTPSDVLANHPQGQLAVRSVLMRMPR